MPLPSAVKQPAESRLYSMDFTALLAKGEALSGVTSVTFTPADGVLSLVGPPIYAGNVAQQRIAAGANGTKYTVTFLVTTSAGNTLEGEGELQVREL